ncbi:MAG: DivIVA domain-containing protein [Syntrophothermus sp.]
MKFSPLNIRNQQFTKAMRGYAPEEVHAFLDKLAEEFEKLNEENDALKKEAEKNTAKIAEFRKIEKNLQDTLLRAHESTSKVTESAKKQSNLIIKEAEVKAVQLLENAKEEAERLRNSVYALKEEKNLIVARLRAMINTQANLLEIKVEQADKGKPAAKAGANQELPREKDKTDINIDDIIEKLL